MASTIALLCLLAGLLVASPAVADFGVYYQIGFLWPGAYCAQTSRGCCMPATGVVPASDFYISSFTVYNATTNAPLTRCKQDPFDLNEIIEINDLKKYWSNIKCPSNNGQSSWKNAWKTAGVCSGLEEKDFFEAALALRKRFNPLARLTANGATKGIKTVIRKDIGVTPVIQCSKGPFDKFQLYQIYVCATSEEETFIDCPAPPKYNCSSEILFHPFKKWMLKKQQPKSEDASPFELPGIAMDQ
ncbi:hypothetical protein EJB05_43717 [Eragrostis curvula]|uniref:Uncharacterized protein n=1 Tax=Eragrostis curvula TaxID=38414 RepID=A0A5J9TFX5_9POAL|nr:hypothetical protein EJB05_43717 [Eragrostis curvula]